ncbi:hypothetical protein BDZ45DRAFT_735590 [Acephala macrosclerotiorum]|nr:hypothetical protein BDZ45DRAFT_735590 [Acephala macrosclerotiorum]
MRVSTIVALLAVAGVPASCKKDATTTSLTWEQYQEVAAAEQAWEETKVQDPAYRSFVLAQMSWPATATNSPDWPLRGDEKLDEMASKYNKAVLKQLGKLPPAAKSYASVLYSEQSGVVSSLTKSVLEKALTATYTLPTHVEMSWPTVSAKSGFETIIPRARHKHSSATSKASSTTSSSSLTTTGLMPEQSGILSSALDAFWSTKSKDPAFVSVSSVISSFAAARIELSMIPPEVASYYLSVNSEVRAMGSSLVMSLLQGTASSQPNINTLSPRARHKHSSGITSKSSSTNSPSSSTITGMTPEQSAAMDSAEVAWLSTKMENPDHSAFFDAFQSALVALETSTPVITQSMDDTDGEDDPYTVVIAMLPPAAQSYFYEFNSDSDLSPRAPRHEKKLTTSVSEWTSQKSSRFDEALTTLLRFRNDSPAFKPFIPAFANAELRLPRSARQELHSAIMATETGSSAKARLSSAIAKLPLDIQNAVNSQTSELDAFRSSFSNSVFGSTSIATPASTTGAAIIAASEEAYSFASSDDDKSESSPGDSNMTPQEEAEFRLAQTQYNALIMSPEYDSMKERLKEEPSDLPDADDFWDPERSQKGKFDARLKRFLKPFPSYARTLISSEIALQNKMHTITQHAATRTKAHTSAASTLSKRQTGRSVDDQAYTKTIVDVFTVTSMTPEQSAEVDRKIEEYLESLESSPEMTSISAKLENEKLDRTFNHPPPLVGHTPFPTGAGKSAIEAWISDELDLVPTYEQTLISSLYYGIISVASDVLNAATTSGMSALTPASPETTIEGPATSPESTSKPANLSSKTQSAHTKHGKKGTITSRAVLPRGTAILGKDWTPKQISALEDGLESLFSSLDTDPTAISLASKYSTYFTALVWTRLQGVISSIASSQTQVSSLCKVARVSSVPVGLPADGASFLCRYWDAESSLFSSVDKMRGPTTKPTTLKTKAKREKEYTDPVYGTKTPDPYKHSAEFEAWFDRYFSAIHEEPADGDSSTASPYTRTLEYLTTTSTNGHLEFLTVHMVVVPGTPSAIASSNTASSKPTRTLDTNGKSAAKPKSRIHSITSATTANVDAEFATSLSSKVYSTTSTTTPSSYDSSTTSSPSKTDSIESARTADFDNGFVINFSSKFDSTATSTASFDDQFATNLSSKVDSTTASTARFDEYATSLSSDADSSVSATPDDLDTKFAITQPSIESTVSVESKVSAELKLSVDSAASTASAVNKQVTSATKPVAVSPTHHSSASSREMLTAGVLGVCLIGVMALL